MSNTTDECAANSFGHKFGPHGPKGAAQCEYCGEADVEGRTSVDVARLATLTEKANAWCQVHIWLDKHVPGWNEHNDRIPSDSALRVFEALLVKGLTSVRPADVRHQYQPHPRHPYFCKHCGYSEHERLQHFQPEDQAP